MSKTVGNLKVWQYFLLSVGVVIIGVGAFGYWMSEVSKKEMADKKPEVILDPNTKTIRLR